MSTALKKRIAALEARQVSISTAPKHLIATALEVSEVSDAEPHVSELGGVVTFHNKTLALAFADRVQWLSQQTGVIAMVSPLDSGRCVEKVLAERHADDS